MRYIIFIIATAAAAATAALRNININSIIIICVCVCVNVAACYRVPCVAVAVRRRGHRCQSCHEHNTKVKK